MNLYLLAGLVVIGGAVGILMMSVARGTDDVVKKTEKRFPKITAENLERRKFNLPEDFEGELNVLLFGFAQEQQKAIDTWIPQLQKLTEKNAKFKFYEIPVGSALPQIARDYIDNAMRRGISDRSAREITITLYLDKKQFAEDLGLSGEKTIQVLLVDRRGEIFWKSEGVYEPEKLTGLETKIAEITKSEKR